MQYKNHSTSLQWALLSICIVGLGLITVFRNSSAAPNGVGATPPQDVIRLENRISQMEQRLYTFETTLRNVEQQSRLAGSTSRRGEELALLTSSLQSLQNRIAEHECALAKLDERTLAPATREARRKSGADRDPCRMNFEMPLRLD